MEDKIREEKGLEADFVYDGYNKANLMAAAEKDSSDKKARNLSGSSRRHL